MPKKYDVIVIGGGTGGLRMAMLSANSGFNTALIEPGVLGGTCLNTGCIPTKAMLYAAHLYDESLKLSKFGIKATGIKVNFPKLMSRVRGIIKEGQGHISKSIKKKNLTLITKKASFVNKTTLQVGRQQIQGKKIVICTGATNFVPPIPGIHRVKHLDNEEVMKLNKLPKSIIMIGCGYISMEFATFFSRLGSKVSMLEVCPQVLGMLDRDVREELLEHYQDKIHIETSIRIEDIRQEKGRKAILYHGPNSTRLKKITAEHILLATGRLPNTKDLNLEAARIKTNRRGGIIVNKYMETSTKNVYALGDCIVGPMFAHAAKRETAVVLDNLKKPRKRAMDMTRMPWAVFTDPPVAGVGLSETQAKAEGLPIGLLKASFSRVGRAHIMDDDRGFVKIIYNKKNNKILGSVIIGPDADDLIHEIVAVMNSSSPTIDVIRKSIHVHPTIAEVMENLREV